MVLEIRSTVCSGKNKLPSFLCPAPVDSALRRQHAISCICRGQSTVQDIIWCIGYGSRRPSNRVERNLPRQYTISEQRSHIRQNGDLIWDKMHMNLIFNFRADLTAQSRDSLFWSFHAGSDPCWQSSGYGPRLLFIDEQLASRVLVKRGPFVALLGPSRWRRLNSRRASGFWGSAASALPGGRQIRTNLLKSNRNVRQCATVWVPSRFVID